MRLLSSLLLTQAILVTPAMADMQHGFGYQLTATELNAVNARLPDDDYVLTGDDLALGGALFYSGRSSEGWVVESGYGYGSLDDPYGFSEIIDRYTYSRLFLQGGYDWRPAKWFSVMPQAGMHRTTITFKEGQLFNSGPELESKQSHTGWLYGIRASLHFGQRTTLFWSTQKLDLDIGSLQDRSIGMTIRW